MNLLVRGPAILMCCALLGYSDDACPAAVVRESAEAPGLSWTSGKGPAGGDRICTRQQVTSTKADVPLALMWPAAGILSAQIGAHFASSLCCFERTAVKESTLQYGTPARSIETHVHRGTEVESDEYPDLIEDDARTERSSFIGRLWDSSKFVDVDIEFRASASYAHLNQSVFQFVIIDRSPQPITAEWDLPANMSKTMQPYYTRTPGGYRQDIYVFFAKKRPSPAHGVVAVKTAGGNLLGRFRADGFTPEE